MSEARVKKKIICLEDTNGLEQPKRMEGYSDKLDSSPTSTIENGTSLPSNDIEFVGLNAESWKKMIEMEALYPHLCKNISYFDNQTENHQEIIHELDWYGCN